MITFIIPAHNEEAWVGRCVSAIRSAMKSVGTAHEVIVVDDCSTDATSSVARQHTARVLRVEHRHIAATVAVTTGLGCNGLCGSTVLGSRSM